MISYLQNKVNIFLNKLSVKTKYIQVLLDGAYRPTDFMCEITLLRDIKKTGQRVIRYSVCRGVLTSSRLQYRQNQNPF